MKGVGHNDDIFCKKNELSGNYVRFLLTNSILYIVFPGKFFGFSGIFILQNYLCRKRKGDIPNCFRVPLTLKTRHILRKRSGFTLT